MLYIFQDKPMSGSLRERLQDRKIQIIRGQYATEIFVPLGKHWQDRRRKQAVAQGIKEGIRRAVLPEAYRGYGMQPILAREVYGALLPQIAQSWAHGRKDVGIYICCSRITSELEAGVLELAQQYHYIKVVCPTDTMLAPKLYKRYGVGLTGIPKDVPTVAIVWDQEAKIPQVQEIIWVQAPVVVKPWAVNFCLGSLRTTADTTAFGLSVPIDEMVIAALYMENHIKNKEITLDIAQM